MAASIGALTAFAMVVGSYLVPQPSRGREARAVEQSGPDQLRGQSLGRGRVSCALARGMGADEHTTRDPIAVSLIAAMVRHRVQAIMALIEVI
jgi:hypothetical protein